MMKFTTLFLAVIISVLAVSSVFGQKHGTDYNIYFKSGTILLDENISNIKNKSILKESEKYGDRFYRYIQFYDIPSQEEKMRMGQQGIKFLEYIPKNVYVVSVPTDFNFSEFQAINVRSLIEIPSRDKMDIRLAERPFPDWVKQGNEIRLLIQYYSDIDISSVRSELARLGLRALESGDHSNRLTIQIHPSQIEVLASQSFVRYLDFDSQPGEPESDDGRNLHRANAIDVDYFGGYDYDGTGVSVAINDDGFVGPHIDFKGRTDQSDVAGDFTGDHGDMTVGIVGAAGNVDPTMRGMAPGAFLWVRQYSSSLPNTVSLHQNEDVMVFSSSYSNGCNAGYTSVTQLVDEQIYDNPSLIQVFSAGNSNNTDCNYGAGDQWGNITGGHKMGKNVIATANLYNNDVLSGSSSRGPASDGRIKPDIAAHGQGHWSTSPDNTYAAGGGTSAAAPGIAGVLAQLHQAYREMNSGSDAPSALLKAALLNTAYDLGNPGPDFKFGWGKVNAYKALKTIEEGHYLSNSVANGITVSHTLTVPAGVQEMRVMVYWHDVEASTVAQYALVNDLDLRITDLTSTVHYPLVLDHTPNATTLDNDAVPGNDSINNVEQIRITNPSQGNYTIQVTGTSVPQGPQNYFIVYEFYYNEIMVTYPIGGEGLIPGSTDRIHWDAYGNSGTFAAAYSLNGTTWNTISNSISGSSRFVDFPVPNTVSKAKVRISRNGVSDESDAFFSIIETPQNIAISSVCSGTNTVQIVWDNVPNAAAYDVFYLGSMYMDSVGTTNGSSYAITVPTTNQDHWVSVRARGANGEVGRRANAIKADGGDCYLDCISDDDAGVVSLVSPAANTGSCSGSVQPVTVNLTNIGPNVQTGFPIYYQLNNNTIVEDTFTNVLAGGSIESFTFSQPISIGSPGVHTIAVWTGLSNDGAHCNDTLVATFQYFDPMTFFPYIEDFESGTFPPPTIEIINPDGGITWQEAQVIGSDGAMTNAAYMNNYAYSSSGQEDILSVVAFDLTNATYAELEFDVAYTPYSLSYQDGLRVDVSTDCGSTYTQVYFKEGDSLATIPGLTTSTWAPDSAGDWRRDSIDLSAYLGNIVKIRFVNITGYGNSLYLDNINFLDAEEDYYCIPSSNCNVGDEIDDFSFNTINQTSTGCGTDGYSNFLSYSTTLEQGGIYPMSVSTNYSNQFVSMWIDFNNDTIFDNLTERVLFDFNLQSSGTVYNTNVTIPTNANLGAHRMRVRAHWSSSCNDPCIPFTYGETHDYIVVIIAPIPQLPLVFLGPDLGICEGEAHNISAYVTGGTSPYTYLWSTGETTPVITVLPSISTNYQVTVMGANLYTGTDEILITVLSLPLVDLGSDQTLLQGVTAVLDAGPGLASYVWSTGQTTQSISVSTSGTYSVTVSDGNMCSNSDEVEVTVLTANPGWYVGLTSGNHTILVPDFANISIDGFPIEIGDYLGVFYDSLGSLACGGYMAWTGTTGNITAWGADAGNDGFAGYEEFNWKIWKYSTETEYDATATYMQPPNMPNGGNFNVNGLSGITALEAIVPSTQSLQLAQGWSIISSYIMPDEPSLDTVFASVINDLVIMKSGNGNTFWPQWGVNSIGDISPTQGYHLNMLVQHNLDITGIAAEPATTSLTIPQGWSLIGYLHHTPASIASMLSSIYYSIVIVKDGLGNAYWPTWGVNLIGNMKPGKGYLINVSNAQLFTYPAIAPASKMEITSPKPEHFSVVKNTGANMTLGIPLTAWDIDLTSGTELGVFDNVGRLVGAGVFENRNMAISVWGKDELSIEKDGLYDEESFILKIFDGSEREIEVRSWIEGEGTYSENGIAIVGKLALVEESKFSLNNYPNPFGQVTAIEFNIPEDGNVRIELYNSIGQRLEVISHREYTAGGHKLQFKVGNLSVGTYFIKLESNGQTLNKAVQIVK